MRMWKVIMEMSGQPGRNRFEDLVEAESFNDAHKVAESKHEGYVCLNAFVFPRLPLGEVLKRWKRWERNHERYL